jgi:hypothetical protein
VGELPLSVLHVTNGDETVARMEAAGVSGELVPWRDALHEGPVPAGLAPAELAAARARFLAGRVGGVGRFAGGPRRARRRARRVARP